MFDNINEWIKKISYFLIIAAALQNLVPGKAYRKYVRLYTGLILSILILSLFSNFSGLKASMQSVFSGMEEDLSEEKEAEDYDIKVDTIHIK